MDGCWMQENRQLLLLLLLPLPPPRELDCRCGNQHCRLGMAAVAAAVCT
jgi:hypothetical protein